MLKNPRRVEEKLEKYEKELLNEDQLRAVELVQQPCVQDDRFFMPVIEGPPGTGKTTTLAAGVAKKLLTSQEESRFIILCYTHVAAMQAKLALERLGLDPTEAVALTPYPSQTDYEKGIIGCRYDLSDLDIGIKRYLHRCPVLLTTLLGVRRAISAFRGLRINLMIDEFSQVNAVDFFGTVGQLRDLKPYSIALFGDPLQLPVVTNQVHLRPNICAYLHPSSKGTQTKGLRIQYRMHGYICEAVNEMRKIFREFPIQPDPSVANRTLTHPALGYNWNPSAISSPWLKKVLDPEQPLVLIDTTKLGEEEASYEVIKFKEEAKLAAKIAIEAHKSFKGRAGPLQPQILTPYRAQQKEIKQMLPEEVGDCSTIYESQGKEYDMVIVSFVRNNPNKFIGFLEDGQLAEQAYVACSRAKGKLIVLLSFDTFFEGHRMFQALDRAPHAEKVEAEVMNC